MELGLKDKVVIITGVTLLGNNLNTTFSNLAGNLGGSVGTAS